MVSKKSLAEFIFLRFACKKQLFSNVSIELEKGKLAALVGESDNGKSTIGQIFQGFYKIESGTVLLNGNQDLEAVSLESYRDYIGVVPQDIHIFPGTVIDNILLGSDVNFDRLNAFLKEYSFDQLFAKFPQGVATILGEEGINLSGGQKQLVAFARALYKIQIYLSLMKLMRQWIGIQKILSSRFWVK